MLDKDLATLYGVETKVLNQTVKRNIERFPNDFRFELSKEECLRSQFVTSNGRGGNRYSTYAFTEQGVAMLSSVLRSKTAIEVNIQIMRAFVSMRHFMVNNASVFSRLETMEYQQKAMYAANEELLRMNWDIGEMLTKSQETDGWGKKTLQRLAVDLKNEYPERKGFSVRNMQCMMQFYNEYNKELTMAKVRNIPITQSMIAQLGNAPIELPIKHLSWTHNIILIQQVKNIQARYWYMIQCIIGHWQTRYLTEALEVKSLLKDPYIFDMLTFTDQYDERDRKMN